MKLHINESNDELTLKDVIKNAKRQANIDGYYQDVYIDKNGDYGFKRHFPNNLLDWNGEKLIGQVQVKWYSEHPSIIYVDDENLFRENCANTKCRKSIKESVYTDAGFKNRKDYLKSLADDYGVDYNTVAELAYMLGPDEDFDALVTEIEDLVDDYDDVDNPWELERYLRTANYVVYDDKSDESHFYIAPFDNFEDAGYDVARNITQYTSSSWLYTTRNHTRTYYDADRLNTSNLIVGRFYADGAEPSDYIDYDLYDNAEDVIENVRNILDMCEVKTEKY
jgi:hypothetical protein